MKINNFQESSFELLNFIITYNIHYFQFYSSNLQIQENAKLKMQAINDKYNDNAEGAETSVIEHYASIIQLKKSEAKVDLLISLPETDEDEKAELVQMKQNLDTALKEETATLRAKQKKDNLYPLSVDLLKQEDVGKLAKCFLEQERKWKNSLVLEVDAEEQTARIKRYGSQQVLDLPAYYLKVLKEPDAQLFKEGTHCKSIYSADGQFYPCLIEKITEEGYHVKYKKYNSQEVVALHRLRPMLNPNQKVDEIKVEEMTEFKIPDKLKILPNDPQNVKKSKKTKVKALKFAFKNAKVQQVNKQKQQKWKNFNQNSMGSKSGHFKSRQDLDILSKKKLH